MIHLWYIAEFDSVEGQIKLLGEKTSGTSELSDHDSAEAGANDEIISVGSE